NPTTSRQSGVFPRRPRRLTEASLRQLPLAEGSADGQSTAAPQEEPSMTIEFDLQQPGDAPSIAPLLDEATGPDRRRKHSSRYRTGVAPIGELCLVARDDGRVVGSVRYWPIVVVGEPGIKPALLLGPVGVVADRRSERIGDKLMRESLRRADAQGHGIVLLVG